MTSVHTSTASAARSSKNTCFIAIHSGTGCRAYRLTGAISLNRRDFKKKC